MDQIMAFGYSIAKSHTRFGNMRFFSYLLYTTLNELKT